MKEGSSRSPKPRTLGKALQKIFLQEGLLEKIEAQDTDASILMNHSRKDLFFIILDKPCQHMRGLTDQVGLTPPTVTWHLSKMTEAGYMKVQRFRNKNIYWVNGMVEEEDIRLFSLLSNDVNLGIMKTLIYRPGLREKDFVDRLSSKQQIIFRHLSDLEDSGLITADSSGRGRRFFISDLASERRDEYLKNLGKYQATVMALLVGDGLRPKLTRRYGSRLYVELKLPGGNQKRMIECVPWTSVLGKF